MSVSDSKKRSKSASFLLDLLTGGCAIWVIVDSGSGLACGVFFLVNAGTVWLFRGRKFGGEIAHPEPWKLPAVVMSCGLLLAFPALLGAGLRNPRMAIANLLLFFVARLGLTVLGASLRSEWLQGDPFKFRRRGKNETRKNDA